MRKRTITGFLLRARRNISQVVFLAVLAWTLAAVPVTLQPAASQSEANYEFGQLLHFSLLVQSSTPVEEVTLFFQATEMPAAMTIPISIEPAQEIRAEHTEELNRLRLAPFTTVTYWWQVRDSAGNTLDVPAQTLIYEDDRFEWRQVSRDSITVRWTGEDAALGQTALDVVIDSLPRLEAVIPGALPDPLRIYIYPSTADLQSALRLTGREWVGGHASPELGVILVTAANPRTAAANLRQDIPHELSHLLLYQATGQAYAGVPRWFDEGLASYMEAAPNPNEALILEEAVAAGTTIPFAQLCTAFPADSEQAVLAYVQSVSLINFIQSEYGNAALNQMIQAVADGAGCQSLTDRVLDRSLAALNQSWLQSFVPQTPLAQVLQRGGIWLLLVLAGFGLMAIFLWPVNTK